MKTLTPPLWFAALLCGLLIATGGCAGFNPKGPSRWSMPWSKKDKPPKPYPNPVKMAVTWSPDTLVQTGRTPTRGFGGRLFFYDEKTRPVPVEGDLTVHAFAENADGSIGDVKRYHYTAEQFTQHFSQSDLGASYSVWIPWDAVGGDQMRVSLVPSFRTAGGKLVQGELAWVGLPGRRTAVENIAKRPDRVSELIAARDATKSGLTTTTIPIRRDLGSLPQPQFAAPLGLAGIATSGAGGSVATAPQAKPTSDPARKPLRLGQAVSPASAELPIE